jgi:hypothetical protein
MKLVIHYLEQIEGVAIFPIIALIIFFTVFTVMTVHTFSLKKEDVGRFARLPLEDEETNPEK